MHSPDLANFNVVLVEPEIPQNTGNIGRLCVGSKSKLHLIEPLGFDLNEKQVKRAGLDYWPHLMWQTHSSFEEWEGQIQKPERVFYFTTKTDRPIYDVQLQPGDTFVFGKETKGLAPEILEKNATQIVTLPMEGPIRSFNLANSVAMALGEGMRQLRALGNT